MSIQKVFLFLFFLGITHTVPSDDESDDFDFQNELECDLDVECPKGWAIYRVIAEYDNSSVDRQWYWGCRKISDCYEEYCRKYEEINSFGELMAFRCPRDSYISGLWSTYSVEGGTGADRVWSIKCCKQPCLCVSDCCLSDYLSDFEEDIDYSADPGTYHNNKVSFVGLFSHFDAPTFNKEGRKWKVAQCHFEKCSLGYYFTQYGHEKYYYYKNHYHHKKHHGKKPRDKSPNKKG